MGLLGLHGASYNMGHGPRNLEAGMAKYRVSFAFSMFSVLRKDPRWASTLLGLIALAMAPISTMLYHFGPKLYARYPSMPWAKLLSRSRPFSALQTLLGAPGLCVGVPAMFSLCLHTIICPGYYLTYIVHLHSSPRFRLHPI